MKKFYTLFVASLIASVAMTQSDDPCESCLPDGITFTSQSQIDNFPIIYPNCTEIEGAVLINGDDISDLSGLNNINSIGGKLKINGCSSLQSLSGLENVNSIEGDLAIGLEGPWGIGNPLLDNIQGLSSLDFIGGSFILAKNNSLIDLSGLNSLDTIEGSLLIGGLNVSLTPGNESLVSIAALSELDYIGGAIMILANPVLNSLSGLENINIIDGYLVIMHNNQITDLSGINNIISVGGDLIIAGNNSLVSLNGLNSLDSIHGRLSLGLTQIWIFGDTIWGNPALTSIEAFQNLTFVGSSMSIKGNESLSSLVGLDNIHSDSIWGLYIHNNASLSGCEVNSVCEYLANPNDTIVIHDNAIGCNSQEEVEDACELFLIEDYLDIQELSISPNPSSSSITIELPAQPSKNTLMTLSNTQGKQLITQPITEPKTNINISHLPAGIYFVQLRDDSGVMKVGKVMVE